MEAAVQALGIATVVCGTAGLIYGKWWLLLIGVLSSMALLSIAAVTV